jgi:hypothetical protein
LKEIKMVQKKWLLMVLAVFALSMLPAVALAKGGGTDHFGPFFSTTTDGSSCGIDWANDTFDRSFTVKDNGDGTFSVREEFKNGSFVTNGATSPGRCETTSNHHGSTVTPGIAGQFTGFLAGTVTSATYNPNGCATPGTCTTTGGFITAVFGAAAPFDITSFNFEYNSSDKSLQYHHWQDMSDNHGGEKFEGDIATQ